MWSICLLHLIQEEVEALDDEQEDEEENMGSKPFKRASAEELAGRRIIKIKRYEYTIFFLLDC
jgi:hypothetical protein